MTPTTAWAVSTQARVEDVVQRERVEHFFAHRPHALFTDLAFALIYPLLFWGKADKFWTLAWASGMLLATAMGWRDWLAFRRASIQPGWDPAPHLRADGRLLVTMGTLIGSMGILFYHPDMGDARWATVFTLTALAAGMLTIYAYNVRMYYAWLALLTLPLAFRFWQVGAPGGWVAYFLIAFPVSGLALLARRQSKLLLDGLRARHLNAFLVADLEAKTQALEEANNAKARFFASASHDLRQPLQALGHYADLLQPRSEDALHVQRIRECLDSLDDLLDGVLTISRLDAGTVQRHLQAVDLAALLSRQRTLFAGLAQAKGLQVRLRVTRKAAAGAWGLTDPQFMDRVVSNLLTNAVRYTHQGGVLLALRWRAPVADAGSPGAWRVQVIDTGIGIAAKDRDRVFEEFVQLGNPERNPERGVGLGLATVQRLCRLLEHPLALTSRPGRGTLFSIEVPVSVAPTPQSMPQRDDAAALQGSVLLVEDNPLVRESVAASLRGWGLTVDACADAAQGLALLAQRASAGHPHEVVLTDFRLPGPMNGWALLREVARTQPPALRVLMTGESLESLQGLPMEGVTLLSKPLKPLRLRALISSRLAVALAQTS
jgi:two-component system, sensor histidine kinase